MPHRCRDSDQFGLRACCASRRRRVCELSARCCARRSLVRSARSAVDEQPQPAATNEQALLPCDPFAQLLRWPQPTKWKLRLSVMWLRLCLKNVGFDSSASCHPRLRSSNLLAGRGIGALSVSLTKGARSVFRYAGHWFKSRRKLLPRRGYLRRHLCRRPQLIRRLVGFSIHGKHFQPEANHERGATK